MRILTIENGKRLADTLVGMIRGSGYCIGIAYDGLEGLDLAKGNTYDAIVLDVMPPGLGGLDVLSRLRGSRIMTPVFMLIAKSALADCVGGLDARVDHYLAKPFEDQEFLARLWAVLRRQADIILGSFIYGDPFLAPPTSQLLCNRRAVSPSAGELELIRPLIQNCSRFLPKEMLLMKVWGCDPSVNASSAEVYISFLRKKLPLLGSSVCTTVVRNIGYQLEVL